MSHSKGDLQRALLGITRDIAERMTEGAWARVRRYFSDRKARALLRDAGLTVDEVAQHFKASIPTEEKK